MLAIWFPGFHLESKRRNLVSVVPMCLSRAPTQGMWLLHYLLLSASTHHRYQDLERLLEKRTLRSYLREEK